jgi:hypothetical protein
MSETLTTTNTKTAYETLKAKALRRCVPHYLFWNDGEYQSSSFFAGSRTPKGELVAIYVPGFGIFRRASRAV